MENDGRVIVKSNDLPPENKIYRLCNPPTINWNDEISKQWSMGCINPIVGAHSLHNVAKSSVKFVNAITTFVETTPSTNITTNKTIRTQYSIK